MKENYTRKEVSELTDICQRAAFLISIGSRKKNKDEISPRYAAEAGLVWRRLSQYDVDGTRLMCALLARSYQPNEIFDIAHEE